MIKRSWVSWESLIWTKAKCGNVNARKSNHWRRHGMHTNRVLSSWTLVDLFPNKFSLALHMESRTNICTASHHLKLLLGIICSTQFKSWIWLEPQSGIHRIPVSEKPSSECLFLPVLIYLMDLALFSFQLSLRWNKLMEKMWASECCL